MAVRRAKRPDDSFVVVSKSITENRRLSWAARGLHIYVLGKPDDWVIRLSDLINQTADCQWKHTRRDGMRELIKELVAEGYWSVVQDRGGEGTFSQVEYVAHDFARPVTENPEAVVKKRERTPCTGVENPSAVPRPDIPSPAPLTALPAPALPLPANPPLLKNELLPRNEKVARNDGQLASGEPIGFGPRLIEPTHSLRQAQPTAPSAIRQRQPGLKVTPRKLDQAEAAAAFDAFWRIWPRRVGIEGARKALAKALLRSDLADILAGLRQALPALQRQMRRDKHYVPHPATWLNDGRWDDEHAPESETGNSQLDRLRETHDRLQLAKGGAVDVPKNIPDAIRKPLTHAA